MSRILTPSLQNAYAELIERCSVEKLEKQFPTRGNFSLREVKGKKYWYYKPSMQDDPKRKDRYIGPDSDELRSMVERHRDAKAEEKDTRQLVVALQRVGMMRTDKLTGDLLQAMAEAGVFRLRAVVVGSTAYPMVGGLLGWIMSAKNSQTRDLDIAQFPAISVGVDDQVDIPFIEILQQVDKKFRALPHLGRSAAMKYVRGDGDYRVEVLAPNRGPDDDSPVSLPALRTDAQPLRYLDFLIRNEVKAVALHGYGVMVNVPAPERYAVHKLLVSRMRSLGAESQVKAGKDMRQAAELIDILLEYRPYDLLDAWNEASERGPKWRQYLSEALAIIDRVGDYPVAQDLRKLVGWQDVELDTA